MNHKPLIESVIHYKYLIEQFKGKWSAYEDWYKQIKPKKSGNRSWSRTYCFYLFRAIKVLEGDLAESNLKEIEKPFLTMFPAMANDFLEVAKEYTSTIEKNSFQEKEWYFYFLSVAERKSKHLKIARALLTTTKNGNAKLKNLQDGFSKDYSGTFDVIEGNRKVVYFDLKDDLINTTRELHIKAVYMDHQDELMLGTYTTYDEQFVYSGLIVLEQITGKKLKTKEKAPILCSNQHNKADFIKINTAIRQYLSLKARNYRSVPRTIPTIEELQRYLDEYIPLKNKKNRFLELEKPRIYLATPQSSVESQSPEIDLLIKDVVKALDHENVDLIHKETDPNQEEKKLKSLDSLKVLKRTRFFILLIADVNKASFSLVQLGWALAHCKYIMIVYKDKSVSERLKSISGHIINKHPYKSLKTDKRRKEVVKSIKTFVDDHILIM